jgi:hypothetical protein
MENVISSLSQYMDDIKRLQELYPSAHFQNPTSKVFNYRGISNWKYTLIPSVFRKQRDKDSDLEREIENSTYLELAKPKTILQAFIQEASAYINVPSNDLTRWAEYAQHYGVPTRFLDWTNNRTLSKPKNESRNCR